MAWLPFIGMPVAAYAAEAGSSPAGHALRIVGLLRLATPGSEVATLLSTTGPDRQLRVYHSVEAAVSGIGSR